MSKKLYVGGLSWNTSTDALRAAFAKFGEISEAMVVADRETGRSRGFGFVSFADHDNAEQAIEKMNGVELDGRTITVNLAREKSSGGRDGPRRSKGSDRR